MYWQKNTPRLARLYAILDLGFARKEVDSSWNRTEKGFSAVFYILGNFDCNLVHSISISTRNNFWPVLGDICFLQLQCIERLCHMNSRKKSKNIINEILLMWIFLRLLQRKDCSSQYVMNNTFEKWVLIVMNKLWWKHLTIHCLFKWTPFIQENEKHQKNSQAF